MPNGINSQMDRESIIRHHVELRRFRAKIDPPDERGCMNWNACKTEGYGRFTMGGIFHRAHRLSWELHNERVVPDGYSVLHKCDNPSCVNPDHLFLGTQADNLSDMKQKGRARYARGEDHVCAILTKEQVEEILRSGGAVRNLASKYCVHPTTIRAILAGRNWKSVSQETAP